MALDDATPDSTNKAHVPNKTPLVVDSAGQPKTAGSDGHAETSAVHAGQNTLENQGWMKTTLNEAKCLWSGLWSDNGTKPTVRSCYQPGFKRV